MSFIADALGSAATPAGTNAAQDQNQARLNTMNELTGSYGQLLPQATHLAQNSLAYASRLQPYYQEALNRGIYQNTDQDNIANAQAQSNNAMSNAAAASRQAQLGLTAQGAGEGAIGGATQQLYGQAANQSNQDFNAATSPQARQQAVANRIGLLSSSQTPNVSALQQTGGGLMSASYGSPNVQVAANPLGGILGQIAETGATAAF